MFDQITFTGVAPSTVRFHFAVDGLLMADSDIPGSPTAARAPDDVVYPSIIPNFLTTIESSYELLFRGEQGGTAWTAPWTAAAQQSVWSDAAAGVNNHGYVDFALTGSGPLGFHLGLAANVRLERPLGTLEGTGAALFYNTALFGIQALDALGNDVTSAAGMTFASGASYPVTLSAVPEPTTVVLLGAGLLGLAAWSRRRARG